MQEDILKIQQLIARFANSFDVKAWDELQACFTETIYTDYSNLRGTPPETIPAKEYVKLRRDALDHLKLHHLVGNYEIEFLDPSTATCRASMVVWRKGEAEDFVTHCVYVFQVLNANDAWKISEIIQKILWSEGTPAIHKGVKN